MAVMRAVETEAGNPAKAQVVVGAMKRDVPKYLHRFSLRVAN
jgi:hypothetical protein